MDELPSKRQLWSADLLEEFAILVDTLVPRLYSYFRAKTEGCICATLTVEEENQTSSTRTDSMAPEA